MADVQWSMGATDDYDGIIAHLAAVDPAAAWRYADELRRLADSLSEFPNRGRPSGRFRELTAAAPYVMRYAVSGSTVTIVSLRHGRQAPSA